MRYGSHSLDAPVELDALAQDGHLPLTPYGGILDVPAGLLGVPGGRFLTILVQHGLDRRAAPVGIPRPPRLSHPV